jgi:hypothetical protein
VPLSDQNTRGHRPLSNLRQNGYCLDPKNPEIALYTLQYSTTRAELWRWYWRAWRRPAGLWRFHVLIGIIVALGMAEIRGPGRFSWIETAVAVAVGTACCMVLLPLWPQIKFKPQLRTLKVDQKGFETSIGRLQGVQRWEDIREVHDDGESIVLTTQGGNAMLIPRRAFGGPSDRQQFFADVVRWHTRENT